jgi:hypothetical protein
VWSVEYTRNLSIPNPKASYITHKQSTRLLSSLPAPGPEETDAPVMPVSAPAVAAAPGRLRLRVR